MRCSYCFKGAGFKCGIHQSYMCETHLEEHFTTFEDHEHENLDIDLGEPRLQKLRSAIIKRIQNINESRNLMLSKTQSLIKAIKDVHKGAMGRLNASREECLEILQHYKFCNSELPKIEKIERDEFDLKLMEIDEILAKTEKIFGAEFVNYFEKRIVREK